MAHIFNKIMTTAVFSMFVLMFFIGICSADKISHYIKNWEYTQFQAKITYVSPEKDYIIASERMIFLVDLIYEGKHYQTNIKDINGNDISFEGLKVDKWVFVRGGKLKDKTIGARSIFLLPRSLKRDDAERYPVLQSLQSWDREIVNKHSKHRSK
ncbi:MAG: hypothetical protein U9P49_06885 [Thermodesulfobacteriota bacterium]|nr:hypothetical protein [Thermodesulfobacteriota bacterium]